MRREKRNVTGFGGQQSSETLSWYYDLELLYVDLFRRSKPGTERPRQRFRPRSGVSRHEQSHDIKKTNQTTYLMPRSMCSWMPKPKFPFSEKFSLLSSYSFTLRPLSRISSA